MTTSSLHVDSSNAAYLEALYEDFLRDPQSLPAEWRQVFASWADGNGHAPLAQPFRPRSIFNPLPADRLLGRNGPDNNGPESDAAMQAAVLQERVDQLIRSYRVRGHLAARINPLAQEVPELPELSLAAYDLTADDLERPFSTTSIGGPPTHTLRELIDRLRNTYCRYIGVQFMHIDEPAVRNWLQERMEAGENRLDLDRDVQLRILTKLTDAVVFEQFVRQKFIGAKSFSLEGAESLIPLLHLAIEKAADQGVQEIVLGMAHRGRLNVLVNILGKSPLAVFQELGDRTPSPGQPAGSDDVRYHLGHSSDWTTASGRKVHLSLCFNPSHLEFIDPVAVGRLRAKQDRHGAQGRERGLALLVHGDASFAAEGVVQETLNLSQLPGYAVGGTLHVIVNNQIGFTTSPAQARSSVYASDVARMLQIPIFHVNGEHSEAVAQVVDLALDFRRQFQRDVVIDMYCYRRLGHNETDEPRFTQPRLYRQIDDRTSVREGYLKHLLSLGKIEAAEADRIESERRERLEQALREAQQENVGNAPPTTAPRNLWSDYQGGPEPEDDTPTGVERERLVELLERLTTLPQNFHLHGRLEKFLEARREMARSERPIDWSTAEALAFGSLAVEGFRVRVSGQDTERGTFSQRHAVLHDRETGEQYTPLAHLAANQAPVQIINSPLSEAGVLGFEYGYSLDWPDGLIGWEAQFGDFINAAQVIVDQFLISAEDKWRRLSGVVLLLPHGYEGQGPEHSSARLERFLTLAAEDNIQVVYPTTPAQYFHCLRRQVVRRWRKPLVVMTPKSLLRHPRVASPLEELAGGRFERVLAETHGAAGSEVWRILLCSGKVYYDLIEALEGDERQPPTGERIAIVRLEQLYPLPERPLRDALAEYPTETPAVWVQEEPENAGAWRYVRVKFGERLFDRFPLRLVSRGESASPATGSAATHKLEQRQLLAQALGDA